MNNNEMLNNEQQQEALNTLAQFVEAPREQILKLQESHAEPPKKLDLPSQNAYINMMTDMVFTNPYVLVRMEDDTENAGIYHHIITYKDGSEHHGLIIYTHANLPESGTPLKVIPFVEIMETFVQDPVLETCRINPTEDLIYILYPQDIEHFLQFKPDNIEFIGL